MRQYRYRVTVEQLTDSHGIPSDRKPLQFEAGNHDDIISVVTWLRSRGDFSSQDDAAAFAVGLKLFAGAILANKDNPLLSSFLPHVYQFVKELKAGPGDSQRKD
ncbi:DUF3861 domain-containing protein [Pseudomonas aeruginosa]|jgi:hypothetical protein|uniref:DUF3861 domain-containing protein n=1 Tax=Pseudomonadota TaxID=1224 RepID=UPI0004976FD4|nr:MULTISPECIES: DUF3861 domain-containing protein [Pseudomonadota]EKY0574400.1 DUF3861 domain-containing protein [Pseudomonas aeruginosa]QCJ29700.1 DUF3861 domain-containing protein [Pseudomonas aeruginosa]QDD53412.1 DUF3861 domain-containing protein [Pseudomonas aeruginosa]VTP98568.1 Domain of Uncharacterised Function with PDB structure [Pseudomonas aeruginosa]HBN9824618.1 DUF3861 domain-containing protein [Pseudomonas aeruginosa]